MSIQKGFTLVEMMVVVAIIGILAVVAIHLYNKQTYRARRVDAINTLMSISLREERYRSSNTQYGTLAQVWGGVSTTAEGFYTIAITNVSATSYTITATAVGNQTNDTGCTSLVLSYSNGTMTRTPTSCWPT